MDGKIAIEEHFVTPELEDLVLNPGWPPDAFRRTLDALEDVDGHLETMDRNGIAVSVLSLASDGVQGIDDRATAVRRRARPTTPSPPASHRIPTASPASPRLRSRPRPRPLPRPSAPSASWASRACS
jgi:hypothetical protein